ncbi:ganglioside GM2 activator-like [Rana temporaria]|uniref:ganglioside GM2 activator-like n=1 Tax=Rana temporaria TaxID=8407 RepID=UPI001AADC3AD|nr:ganglioside GM2 activator-like [Rana temporaria]
MGHVHYYFLFACVAYWTPLRVTAVNDFSWANCDGKSLPVTIQTLTILPDGLRFPGEMTMSTILNTTVALTSPIKMKVTAEKFMQEWIMIPCLNEVGSCTYDDFCDILNRLIKPGKPCPGPLHTHGLPCRCPFQSGSYYLPVTSFHVPDLHLPATFTSGNYRISVVLNQGDQEIGCVKINFSLARSFSHLP